jgi:hypothetical protein
MISGCLLFLAMLIPLLFYLIPQPLLPGEKGCNNHLIIDLAPLPWERGWGEVLLNIISPGTALPIFTGIFNTNPWTIFNFIA